MSKTETKIVVAVLTSLITAWIIWVSKTLVQHDDQIGVLRFAVLHVAAAKPTPGPSLGARIPRQPPSLAYPILPIPEAFGLKPKEDSYVPKTE